MEFVDAAVATRRRRNPFPGMYCLFGMFNLVLIIYFLFYE